MADVTGETGDAGGRREPPTTTMTTATEGAGRRRTVAVLAVVVIAAGCVAQAFGRFTWGLVLPEVRDELLGGSNTIAGLLGTVNFAAYLLGTQVVAAQSRRRTLEQLLVIGVSFVAVGLAVASVARSGPAVGVALALMGVGGSAIWIPAPALAARAVAPQRVGFATGLITSGIGVGVVMTGQLTSRLGDRGVADAWQTVFRVELVVTVVVLASALLTWRDRRPRPAGAAASAAPSGWSAVRTMPGWRPLTVAYGAYGFSYILSAAFFVARLEDDAGLSASEAAELYSVRGVATIFGGIVLGPLSDRIGRRVTMIGSFIACGMVTLLSLTDTQPWLFVAAAGFGIASLGPPTTISAHVVANTTSASFGSVFGTITIAFGAGQMIAPQIGGLLADRLGSFTVVFVLSAVVAVGGAWAALRLPPDARPHRHATSSP